MTRALALIAAGTLLLIVGTIGTPFMVAATISYVLLCSGAILRKNRKLHPWLMLAAIALDLAIVLILQLQRSAVQTALAFTLSMQQQAHILASSSAVALYFPVVIIGLIQWREPSHRLRFWHVRLGWSAFALRTLGFILMFSLLGRK